MLCPGGQLLRNPTEDALARCIGMVGPIDPDRLFDVVVVGAGPAGLATAVYAGVGGAVGAGARLPRVRRPGGRFGADRELSRLPDRHFRHGADGAGLQPGAEIRRRDGHPRRSGGARMRQRSAAGCTLANGERSRRAPWSSRPAPATGGSTSTGSKSSKARRSITGPRRSRRSCARAGGRTGRRRQFGGPGGGVPRRPGRAASR